MKPDVGVHGKKIVGSEHVTDVFRHKDGINNFVNEIKE